MYIAAVATAWSLLGVVILRTKTLTLSGIYSWLQSLWTFFERVASRLTIWSLYPCAKSHKVI